MKNDANLRQYNVSHYAGPASKLPKTLPFGDYYFAEDVGLLYKYNYQKLPMVVGGGGSNLFQRSDNFSSLLDGKSEGNLAYVKTSQGVKWLPGRVGGSYYPAGWYIWNGQFWQSDRNSIASQFQTNIDELGNKVERRQGYELSKNDLTDALKSAYDTAYQWVIQNGQQVLLHIANRNNPHNVNTNQLGIGNVDNTSDLQKPISNDVSSALSLKQNKTNLFNIYVNFVDIENFLYTAPYNFKINLVENPSGISYSILKNGSTYQIGTNINKYSDVILISVVNTGLLNLNCESI